MPDRDGRLTRAVGAVRRRVMWIGAIGAAGLIWAAPAFAAEPSIRVAGAPAIDGVAAGIDRLGGRILSDVAAAREGTGRGEIRFFDLNKPLGEIPGFDGLPPADRLLMRGAKQTYDLFRALGGAAVDSFAAGATAQGRFYLSLDGEGGRWLATPGEALTALARQLAGRHIAAASPAVTAAATCPDDYRCLLKSLTRSSAPTIATVPRGATVDLTITGKGFSDAGGTPVLIAPEGITLREVSVIDPENLTARLSIDADAPPGRMRIQVFNPGHQFHSQQTYYLQIVPDAAALDAAVAGQSVAETGKPPPLADDYGNDKATAAVLASRLAGRLEASGDTDTFRIEMPQNGLLAVSSEGPTDLIGELRDAKGNLVAANDDGGERYNFRIEMPVRAGIYYLSVRHCCAGKGAYVLNPRLSGE